MVMGSLCSKQEEQEPPTPTESMLPKQVFHCRCVDSSSLCLTFGGSRQSTASTSEVGKFPTRKLSISHGNTLVPDTEKTIFNNPANSQDLQNFIAEEDEENDQ